MSFPEKRPSVRLSRRSLHTAVANGKISDVETLLFSGIPVDTSDNIKRTALHVAAAIGDKQIISLLLLFGAQVTDCDYKQKSTLHFAAQSGSIGVVKNLLEAPSTNGGPIDINAKDAEQETPLHVAALKGHFHLIKYLIKCGAQVDARKENHATPLHFAAAAGNSKAVKELLNGGAQVNARISDGLTPLHCAVLDFSYLEQKKTFNKLIFTKLGEDQILKQDEVVSILLKAGADPNALNCESRSPLHYTAQRGHLVLMKRLIDAGAWIDLLDNAGRTALHIASQNNSPEIIRILLNSGASVNLMCAGGYTPLHYAVSQQHQKIISMLISAGADITEKTSDGRSVIFLTYPYSSNASLLHLLLESGADINAQDVEGFTFFHNYCSINNDILGLLMDYFIDLNIMNGNRKTALEFAKIYPNKSFDLIKLMVKLESDGRLKIHPQNRRIISNFYPETELKCKLELQILKERKVWGNTRFYDLLSKSINKLAVYIRNQELLDTLDSGACEGFPIYGKLIESRMRMAFQRKIVLDESLEVLTNLISPRRGPKLPRFVGLEILDYLNIVDLKSLSDA